MFPLDLRQSLWIQIVPESLDMESAETFSKRKLLRVQIVQEFQLTVFCWNLVLFLAQGRYGSDAGCAFIIKVREMISGVM